MATAAKLLHPTCRDSLSRGQLRQPSDLPTVRVHLAVRPGRGGRRFTNWRHPHWFPADRDALRMKRSCGGPNGVARGLLFSLIARRVVPRELSPNRRQQYASSDQVARNRRAGRDEHNPVDLRLRRNEYGSGFAWSICRLGSSTMSVWRSTDVERSKGLLIRRASASVVKSSFANTTRRRPRELRSGRRCVVGGAR